MNTSSSNRHQKGLALVFTLLLLLTMTIIGVSTMSSVFIQERMAGNTSLQTLAFEAASAGIASALQFGFNANDNWPEGASCTPAGGAWTGPESAPQQLPAAPGSLRNSVSEFTLQVICREDADFRDALEEAWDPPVQLYVRSRGVVRSTGVSDPEVLSSREVEVRIESIFAETGLPASAIHIQSDGRLFFDYPNSGQFLLDGNGGFAITASDPDNFEIIDNSAEQNNFNGEYRGGIAEQSYPEPWGNPTTFTQLVNSIRAVASDPSQRDSFATCSDINFYGSGFTARGNDAFTGLTYVGGDFGWDQRGTPSGSGVIIVEGDITWSGRATFDGLIISTGGKFLLNGGGNGASSGSMILTNLDLGAEEATFDADIDVNFNGGALNFTYQCESANDQLDVLRCISGFELPDFACDADEAVGGSGVVFAIRSWRENLGWGL